MNNSEELRQQLHSINRKSYPAYKALKGVYHFGNYLLSIDHVQGDPFASPSHVSVQISHTDARFPKEYYKNFLSRTTLCDYLMSLCLTTLPDSLKNRSATLVSVQKAPVKAVLSQ